MKQSSVLRRYRPLIVILLATICIWVGVTMSDYATYPTEYKVEWEGYDQARYTVMQRDSTLFLDIQSNGFRAIGRSVFDSRHTVTLDLKGRIPTHRGESFVVAVGVRPMAQGFAKQLRLHGVKSVACEADTLRIWLSERKGKAFVPEVRNLQLGFKGSYGATGPYKVLTDTVYLYGSAESLSKIRAITTQPMSIDDIDGNDTFRVALDPVWKDYPDVHASTDHVLVTVPVAKFMERTVELPVNFEGNDDVRRHKLYPDHVKVTYLIPMDRLDQVTSHDFKVSAIYEDDLYLDSIPLRVAEFPSLVRIKNITPSHVRYVIIK